MTSASQTGKKVLMQNSMQMSALPVSKQKSHILPNKLTASNFIECKASLFNLKTYFLFDPVAFYDIGG